MWHGEGVQKFQTGFNNLNLKKEITWDIKKKARE